MVSGERLRFDSLLLATGGQPRRIPSNGHERVLYLRTLEDADRIRSHLQHGAHLIVVGAGFIGAEVAASARTLGLEVTMLEAMDVPLRRALGPEMGWTYAAMHWDHGVKLMTREVVSRIDETAGGVVVRTNRGTTIEGDAVVIGVGIDPNVELALSAGLDVNNGIVVDEFCRTSIANIYAAGDVANHYHPLFGLNLRVEHYDNALRQGAAAARNMLGHKQSYDHVHWFWSDQFDYNLQYAGFAPGSDEIVVRGSIDERNFVAFYLRSGVLRAALGINQSREVRRAMRLIAARATPDPDQLRDETLDLRRLTRSS
jgi:3-phenylpropionate/trans-cinnamate dioxygenase ferredoxin reductase subunit